VLTEAAFHNYVFQHLGELRSPHLADTGEAVRAIQGFPQKQNVRANKKCLFGLVGLISKDVKMVQV